MISYDTIRICVLSPLPASCTHVPGVPPPSSFTVSLYSCITIRAWHVNSFHAWDDAATHEDDASTSTRQLVHHALVINITFHDSQKMSKKNKNG